MNNSESQKIRKRLKSTAVLKGIAIILVIINHVGWSEHIALKNFAFWVYQAVPVFAVITGFHYSNSLAQDNDFLAWYEKKRFLKKACRIWIPYTVMFTVSVIGYIILGNRLTIVKVIKEYCRGGGGTRRILYRSSIPSAGCFPGFVLYNS